MEQLVLSGNSQFEISKVSSDGVLYELEVKGIDTEYIIHLEGLANPKNNLKVGNIVTYDMLYKYKVLGLLIQSIG